MSGTPAYRLVRANRRTLSLTVEADGGVLVRAPLRLQKSAIDAFVLSKADWIASQRAIEALRPARTFRAGETLPFCGGTLVLAFSDEARLLRYAGGVLTLPTESTEKTRNRLTAWYKSQAKAVFLARAGALAPLVGVVPGPIRVSDAATRWGSCGKADSLNLNWRLLLAPPDILDYVVLHELCHIGQRDHSRRFWDRVARIMPDWKEKRAWLRAHRAELEL